MFFHLIFLTIKGSLAVVVNDCVVSLLKQFDGGEPLDLHVLQFIGSGVHLGNDDSLMIRVLLSKFVPNWSQLLAMSAPWGTKSN